MRKWFVAFLFLVIPFLIHMEDASAAEGIILIECGDEVIQFPAHLFYTSPFIQKAFGSAPKEFESKVLRFDGADSEYLRILSHLVNRLPLAARNCKGEEVGASSINGNTVFVTKLVQQKLLWALMEKVTTIHQARREGIVSSVLTKTRVGSGSFTPRSENMPPSSLKPDRKFIRSARSEIFFTTSDTISSGLKLEGISNNHRRFPTFLGGKSPEESSGSTSGGSPKLSSSPLSLKLSGLTAMRSASAASPRSPRVGSPRNEDTPRSPRSVNEGVSQILGSLYLLSLDLDIKPITNLIAYTMINRMLDEKRDSKACLKGTLRKQGYGSFSDSQLGYLKKHIALKELKKEEFTVADYLGTNGQPIQSDSKAVDLSCKGLTSLQGVHLLRNSREIWSMAFMRNSLLGSDVDPDFPKEPFRRFSGLKRLFLDGNHLTDLPEGFLKGTSLERLELQGNHFTLNPSNFVRTNFLDLEDAVFQFTPQRPRTFGYR